MNEKCRSFADGMEGSQMRLKHDKLLTTNEVAKYVDRVDVAQMRLKQRDIAGREYRAALPEGHERHGNVE